MWPFFVVVSDPVVDHCPGLSQRLEPMQPDTLLLRGAEEALDEPVLFRRVRCRELLHQSVGLHRARVVATAEDLAIIGPQCQKG